MEARSPSPAAHDAELDAAREAELNMGKHIALQWRDILRKVPRDSLCARVVPALFSVLRHGARHAKVAGARADVLALLQESLASSASLLTEQVQQGTRAAWIPLCLDAILLAPAEADMDAAHDGGGHARVQDDDAAAAADDALSCEAFFRRFKPKSSRGACGYLFQRNDIAFNCRTCQLDEMCVICFKCFQNGNHEGHDIFFHRTLPGGMCDCGDAEAWAPSGFCINHGHADSELDELPLPETTVQIADALFQDVVDFFVEMAKVAIDVFDPVRVDEMGRQCIEASRRERLAQQQSVDEDSSHMKRFHVRVCNDDVHSDEDLVQSLRRKGITDSRQLVRAIDANGSELVASNLELRAALQMMQELKEEGWHVCVVSDNQLRDEDVLLHMIPWVKAMCTYSQGLRQLFCNKLFSVSNAVAFPKEPIHVLFLSDPYFRKDLVLRFYELYLKLQSDKEPKLQFSIVFLQVYQRLMTKYFIGIGTRDESLFQYGVQIFTTPSIVSRLISLGVLDTFLDTIQTALELARKPTVTGASTLCGPTHTRARTTTLDCDHAILKYKRYTYVLENSRYVMTIPSAAWTLLANPVLLRKWTDALREMQGLDPVVRIQDGHAHVTYERQLWVAAFNYHSQLSRLITTICKGLRHVEDAEQTEGAAVSNLTADSCLAVKRELVLTVLAQFWQQLQAAGVNATQSMLHQPILGFGVTDLPYPIVKFDVATQPVSFHYPLHGFLANFLLEALYAGVTVSDWKALLEDSLQRFANETQQDDADFRRLLLFGLVEFPLRTLVLCAQIQSGLWIRNGESMHQQMLHYTQPPLCSELRDLDLFLMQIGASAMGSDVFLALYLDRFGIMEWLQAWSSRDAEATFAMGEDKLVALLESALLQLLWIVTEVPPPVDVTTTHNSWLRREVLHRLALQPCRLSELVDHTIFVTSTPFAGVDSPRSNEHLSRVERVLDEIADIQAKRGGDITPNGGRSSIDGADPAMEPTQFVLKKECFREYDPSFPHLSRTSHEKAQVARQEALLKHWSVQDPPIPLVSGLPPAYEAFAGVRLLVLEKGLLGILRLILEDAAAPPESQEKKTNVMVVLRAIHVVNVIVLVLQGDDAQDEVAARRPHVLAWLRSGREVFEDNEIVLQHKRRCQRGPQQGPTDLDGDSLMPGSEGVADVEDTSIVSSLLALAKDHAQHDSKSTISAMYWILQQLATMDTAIKAFVQAHMGRQGQSESEDGEDDEGLSKAQLQKLHQQRAIAAMMAKQRAFAHSSLFAELSAFDEDEEDEARGDDAAMVDKTVVYRPPPPPDCIICTQKKKLEPVMYIGHAQTSQAHTHALQEKPFAATPLANAFPPSIYLTLCGHAVHLRCWREYMVAVRTHTRSGLEQQAIIACDATVGEFLCPLCQSLSSLLVPYVAPCEVLLQDEQQRQRDAMEKVFQAKRDTSSVLAWLTHGLPSRLQALEHHATDDEEDEDSQGESDTVDEEDENESGGQARATAAASRRVEKAEERAMRQFAISLLETLVRFQPEVTQLDTQLKALKQGFFATGPQLVHLLWSAVASTCTSAQLSGISTAMYTLETAHSATEQFLARKRFIRTSPLTRHLSEQVAVSAPSTLSIPSLLNPTLPPLKTRLAVDLPPSLEGQLDPFSPKDDAKLNCVLRALRWIPSVFPHGRADFYRAIVVPMQLNLTLSEATEEWVDALTHGSPLQLAQPLLAQDLFYWCVAVCSSILSTKAEILLTIRALCVLHMAQVLLQIARMSPEDSEDEEDREDQVDAESKDEEDDEMTTRDADAGAGADSVEAKRTPPDAADSSTPDVDDDMVLLEPCVEDAACSRRMSARECKMARALELLMLRLSEKAGVDVIARAERDGAPYAPPRGAQLLYLFKSSMLAFMRQATLLCRGFFRGEHDPDASCYANFVSSLRLSTDFDAMSEQLGLPSIPQLVEDVDLLAYLDAAALQLRSSRLASIPDDVQAAYRQSGDMEGLIVALEEVLGTGEDAEQDTEAVQLNLMVRNLNQIPTLPIRCLEEPDHARLFSFANVRIVKLAALYTDLHSEVLAHSRCPLTNKIVDNPAICLICEQVLCAGADCCRRHVDHVGVGACTAHAISCGYGVGMFFLLRSSSVLLVCGPRSSYFGSPYLDMFGEEDINLRRGRPLYLNSRRMKALLTLYANHQLANEVSRNRRTSDQYIRNFYY